MFTVSRRAFAFGPLIQSPSSLDSMFDFGAKFPRSAANPNRTFILPAGVCVNRIWTGLSVSRLPNPDDKLRASERVLLVAFGDTTMGTLEAV